MRCRAARQTQRRQTRTGLTRRSRQRLRASRHCVRALPSRLRHGCACLRAGSCRGHGTRRAQRWWRRPPRTCRPRRLTLRTSGRTRRRCARVWRARTSARARRAAPSMRCVRAQPRCSASSRRPARPPSRPKRAPRRCAARTGCTALLQRSGRCTAHAWHTTVHACNACRSRCTPGMCQRVGAHADAAGPAPEACAGARGT
jgi:hypothetical protein